MMIDLNYPRFIWKNYRGLLIFSTLFVALMQFLMLFIITTIDSGPLLDTFLSLLPSQFRVLFLQRSSVEGAAAFGFNHPLVIAILAISAIIIPARHVAGEVETGTLEILLACPIERWRHIITVWFSSAVELMIIVCGGWLGSFLSIAIFHTFSGQIVIGILKIGANLWLLSVLISSYTLLISTFGKEGGKTGIRSAAITLIFYLMQFLSFMRDSLSFLKPFNIFQYYQPQELMFGDRSFVLNAIVLSISVSICLAAAIQQFNRRDVPG